MISSRFKASSVVFLLVLYGCWSTPGALAQSEDLHIISGDRGAQWLRYTDAPNALYRHLLNEATQHLDRRAAAVAALRTPDQWRQRQEQIRRTLLDIIGPFPEKTPLHARTTGMLHKDGYRVEKLVYESMPGFPVTAALFVPDDLQGRAPAILFCSGHAAEGFRSKSYQTSILNFVKKGFIVLAFDPIGQGERLQYIDPKTGASRVGGPTNEHSYPGAQVFISGGSLARYMIWDGIRAIDYLLTREEVDPARIGVAGRSGGGTQSAYIAAIDDRVVAAAPENYITSFQRLLETRGPQDAEQNLYHQIARGIDHADLLAVRAPKPILMVTTTRDIFSIQGARDTYAEVKRIYEALGQPEHFSMVEDDAGHASTPKNREAIHAFFQRHLNLPGSPKDEVVELLSPEELQVTETGQVATSLDAETIFNLNRHEARKAVEALKRSRSRMQAHTGEAVSAAKALSGYREPTGPGKAIFTGRYQRDGYTVEKYFLQGEGDYVVPFLLMLPDGSEPHPGVLYLHPDGKSAAASPDGEMEWFVKRGYAVLAPDLVGTGEMGPGALRGDSYIGDVSYNLWFGSILIGRSLVGIRAGDLISVLRYFQERPDIAADRISAVARGTMAPVLLHAAAFEPSITRVALIEPLVSYRALVMSDTYKPDFIPAAVAGALTAYDLPDLAASLVPRSLVMVNVVDANGNPASSHSLDEDYSFVKAVYAGAGAANRFQIKAWEPGRALEDVFAPWHD